MANIRKGPQTGVLQRRSWVYRGGAMLDPANEHPRIPLPRTWVNKQNAFLLCYTARKFEERETPMTHAREMLDTYPGTVAIMDADALIECIEACFDCSQSCSACADACLGEEMVGHMRRCITMCLNCSDEC